MANLWAGTALSDMTAFSGNMGANTTGTVIATTVCREGLAVGTSGTGMCYFDLATAVAELWLTFRFAYSGGSAGLVGPSPFVSFFNTSFSTTQALFRMAMRNNVNYASADPWVMQYWDGAAWQSVTVSGVGSLAGNVQYVATIRIKMDNSAGEFKLYWNGVLVTAFATGDTIFTAASTIDRIKIEQSGANGNIGTGYWSEFTVDTIDNRDYRVAFVNPTGNGANTAWTGAFGDVDETGVDDTDSIASGTVNQVETYTMSDLAGVTGMDVIAVCTHTRGRRGSTGPQNLQHAIRLSGTDYFSSNVGQLGTAYAAQYNCWNTNPATSANWTQSEINGAEMGVKSIT